MSKPTDGARETLDEAWREALTKAWNKAREAAEARQNRLYDIDLMRWLIDEAELEHHPYLYQWICEKKTELDSIQRGN